MNRLELRELINEVINEFISDKEFGTAHTLLASPYDDDYRGELSAGFDKFGMSIKDITAVFRKFGLDPDDVSMTKRFGSNPNVKSKSTGFQFPVEDGPFGSGVFVSMLNPFDNDGYCHYVGISGDAKFVKSLFKELKKLGDGSDAEMGRRSYI